METNVNYTIVGAFVIALLTAIVLAIIWLSSGFSFQHFNTYLIYMQESVSGLSIDSPVEFNGVQVGSVKSITLNHKNPQLVELLISIQNTTPVTQGTTATLNSRGFTGIAYLALKDKSTDLRPLVRLKGQPYPVIPSTPSLFMRLDIALTRLSKNLQQVTEAIQTLLNKDNQKSIKEILNNLEEMTNNFAENSGKINSILSNTAKATEQLGPLLQVGRSTLRTLEMQTLPTASRLLLNLDEITRTLGEVANQLKQNPSILIRGSAPSAPGPGEKR